MRWLVSNISSRGLGVVLGVLITMQGLCSGARGQVVRWGLLRPYAVAYPAMAYDASRRTSVLFGGAYGYPPANAIADSLEWNGTYWAKNSPVGPAARAGHAMAYDSARDVTVLAGGSAYNLDFADTWERSGTTWTRRVVSGPSPRGKVAMAYDSARRVMVLCGGYRRTPSRRVRRGSGTARPGG